MAFENQSQKDFVDALEAREQELGTEVVDQQAVDDLLSTVVERIESLDTAKQDVVLDGFNDLLGEYEVELSYVSLSSREPLEVFAQDLESKIVDIIGLSDPELVRMFTDVSVLEGQVFSAKSDLDAKQESFNILIRDFDLKTQQREILIQEFHEIIGDRSLFGDLDAYLHASSYLLMGAGLFIKRFNLHDTDYEEKARDLFAQLVNVDKEIREFLPQLQVSSRELQSVQLKYYKCSSRLQNLVGLDSSEIVMDAYLVLGSEIPNYMKKDLQLRVKEFEEFHIDQINEAIHLRFDNLKDPKKIDEKRLSYLKKLKQEVSEENGTPLNRTDWSTIQAAFDTPGSIIRKILEHYPRPGNNGEGFDPYIYISKKDRRTMPANKHYRVKHCRKARKLISQGYKGLAHSSEEFLAPGLSKRQERRNMIFYKREGGKIKVQQLVERRFLKDGTYGYADSYYALEAALPEKVYRESEIHELLEFDRQYAAYHKSEFMSKPEVSVAGSFASKIVPGLQSMQKAVGNQGAKTEEYVKYFKGEAQSLLAKIRAGKDDFLAQKSKLDVYRLEVEQTQALAMSHDVRQQVLKTLNSTLQLMKMIEDGSLEKMLDRVVSPNFHADSFDSWFMEEGIVFVAAVTVAVAITWATVGLGSGASGLLLTSAVSSAGGVLGTEIGLGISHVAGQYYFGEGYENLPVALQGKSLGELVEAYGKQFMTGFVMSVAAIGCGRLAADKLSKFLVKNSANQTLKGSIARFVSRFPGMRMKVDMADHMTGSARMKFGVELLEELSQETLESVAEKFDSRLGFVMAVLFCSRPSLTSMYFDGAAVGIVSNLEVGDTQLIEMQVDRDFSEDYLKQKFPDSIVEVSETGGFVVTHEFNGRKQVVTISRGQSSLDVFSRLPVQAQEFYGLKVESDGSLTFDSLDAGQGKVSLPGYLKSMGYKVQVDEVDGFKVLRVQGENGSEFEINRSEYVVVDGIEYRNVGSDFGTYYEQSLQPEVYLVKDSVKVTVAKGGEVVTPIEDGSKSQIAQAGDFIIQNPLDKGSYIFGYKADGSNSVEQRVAKFNQNYLPSPDQPGMYLDRGCRPAKLLTENVTGMASNGMPTLSLKGGYMVGDTQGAYTISSEAIQGYRLATLEEISQRLPEVKVTEITEGVFATDVGGEFDMQESGNAYMKSVVEMNLGVSFVEINTVLPHFTLEMIFKLSNHINVMDFDQMSHKEMMNCLGVLGLFDKSSERSGILNNFSEKLWDHVISLEPSIVNAPKFLFVRSFFGSLSKEHEYKSWHRWLNENASQDQLASIFINLGVDQFATTNLLGMFDSSKSVAESVAQPPGIGAHFYTISKFAVDFFIESGETVNSPVSGEVVKVHEFEYDLSLNVMNYFDACKAGKVELSLAGVKENMMIPNDSAARKTLELGQRFLDSQEAGSNFINGVRDLIDVGADGVEIKDKEGNRHMILHAQALVSEGDMVEVGQPIVRLDYNSGMSSAPHVHYEVNNSDGSPIPMVDTSQNSSDLYKDNLPGLDRYLRSRIPSVYSVQGVESQQLGDFASVDLSQDVSECEFEGYKVTITKADNGQSKARFESLTDASLNGAELDFTVNGEVATIHWMAAGKSGVGQGKMLFDFLLSRYPVVSTGIKGENISYPAVRRLYQMQQSGDYQVQSTGVKTKLSQNWGYKRKTGKRTLTPDQHYYVARTDDASKIPAPVTHRSMFGMAQPRFSATKARSVKSSMKARVDSKFNKLLESKVARIDAYAQSKGLDVSGLNTEQKLSLILFGSADTKLTSKQRKLIYDAHMIGDGRVIGEYTFADIRQKYVALRKSFTSKQAKLLMRDLQICGLDLPNVARKTIKDENLRAALDGDMSAIQRLTPVQSMMYFDRLIGFFSDVENPKVKEVSNTDDIVNAQISKQHEQILTRLDRELNFKFLAADIKEYSDLFNFLNSFDQNSLERSVLLNYKSSRFSAKRLQQSYSSLSVESIQNIINSQQRLESLRGGFVSFAKNLLSPGLDSDLRVFILSKIEFDLSTNIETLVDDFRSFAVLYSGRFSESDMKNFIRLNPSSERVLAMQVIPGLLEKCRTLNVSAYMDFLNFDRQIAIADGSNISTPSLRFEFLSRMANLTGLDAEWYAQRPFVSDLSDSTRLMELKSFNSEFVTSKMLPEMIRSGFLPSQVVLDTHRVLFRGTQAQLNLIKDEQQDYAGRYRDGGVAIGQYYAPLPERIVDLMNEFDKAFMHIDSELLAIKGSVSEVEFEQYVVQFASFCQQIFVDIHPMRDGNGRTSRLLYSYVVGRHLGLDSPYLTLPMTVRTKGSEKGAETLDPDIVSVNRDAKVNYGQLMEDMFFGHKLQAHIKNMNLETLMSDPFMIRYRKLVFSKK